MTQKSAKFYDSAKKLYPEFGVMCTLRTLFTFETADSTFNRKPSSKSQNDYDSFDERFYDNFFSEKRLY